MIEQFQPLALNSLLNSRIATFNQRRDLGNLNAWGNSLPAEEIPFGDRIVVDAVPFLLHRKELSSFDNLEPLGQRLEVRPKCQCRGIAFLACGEMGDQRLRISLIADHPRVEIVDIPAAMLPGRSKGSERVVPFTHIHFSAGYELDTRFAALWVCRCDWTVAVNLEALIFGVNPLVHLVACTLLLS